MATASELKWMTAEEFLAADLGDGRYELVRGEIVEVPMPMPEHGRIAANATFTLETFGRQSGYGYTLIESAMATERAPDTVRAPDVSFYSHTRWPRSEVGKTLPPVPPDLAVEIYSPSNRRGETNRKVAELLAAGALMVWVIYPAIRSIVIHRSDDQPPLVLKDDATIEDLPELPGFRCAVADFFA